MFTAEILSAGATTVISTSAFVSTSGASTKLDTTAGRINSKLNCTTLKMFTCCWDYLFTDKPAVT